MESFGACGQCLCNPAERWHLTGMSPGLEGELDMPLQVGLNRLLKPPGAAFWELNWQLSGSRRLNVFLVFRNDLDNESIESR